MNNEARILREGIERALTELEQVDLELARVLDARDVLERALDRADKEGKEDG